VRTISASELEHRGIGDWDQILHDGPVHVTKGDKPCYVIIEEDLYQELIEGYAEAERRSIEESLADMRAGRVRPMTAEQLMAELDGDA
jgi:hypothetical protein